MILIYLDESGINYQIKDGLYVDGPFLIYGSLFVYEDVYWIIKNEVIILYDEIENNEKLLDRINNNIEH